MKNNYFRGSRFVFAMSHFRKEAFLHTMEYNGTQLTVFRTSSDGKESTEKKHRKGN